MIHRPYIINKSVELEGTRSQMKCEENRLLIVHVKGMNRLLSVHIKGMSYDLSEPVDYYINHV